MFKKIKIQLNTIIKFCIFNKQRLLVLAIRNKSYYINIPKGIKCSKDENFLYFNTLDFIDYKNNTFIFNFFNYLDKRFKNIDRFFCKKLIFKGIGLKANILINTNQLELKLGFSHIFILDIPLNIRLSINKSVLIIEGVDEVAVGNFAFNVRKLRFPNIYKGKGIWYKNEIKILKTIKKT